MRTTCLQIALQFVLANFMCGQTLTINNCSPIIGQAFEYRKFVNNPLVSLAGQDVAWNYSGEQTSGQKFGTVTPVASSAYENFFSNSSYVFNYGYPVTKYFRISSEKIELTGGDYNNSGLIIYTNPVTIIKYPSSFAAVHIDTFAYKSPNNSYTRTVNGTTTLTADGTGTLTLPGGGTYYPVIRLKSLSNGTAVETFAPGGPQTQTLITNEVDYKWYLPYLNLELLSVYSSSQVPAGSSPTVTPYTTRESFYLWQPFGPVGLTETAEEEPLLSWPNPANDIIKIKHPAQGRLSLTDALGRTLFELDNIVSEETLIRVSGFSSGVYLLSHYPAGMLQASRTKVIIEH